ncbi:MAG: RNA polymerase sigma factor [Saprospiraceae bacterium]|nr:RNA polymerase sigma factor [Saprospiraceae bacterium]MBP7679783.1 RNA polymerase sigma factor [Saprospiraceae bacterium]
MDINTLIQHSKQQNRLAQKMLYDHFAARMMAVCRRYIRNDADAEDVLIEGMFKGLTKIEQYNGEGNFEGWLRKIIVNEALMFLRKQKILFAEMTEAVANTLPAQLPVHIEGDEVFKLLDKLPNGYRTVFNLYVMEGYSHQEIADMLGISINTSKSQFLLAKQKLQQLLQHSELNPK